MKLSVTLVNYNQKYFPRMCIESLKQSVTDFEYEIVAVDNNSTDESVEYLEQEGESATIKFIKSPENLGYGRGHNLAAENSIGEYVLIMNVDITVEKDTLQRLMDYMTKHKEIGILGPKLIYHNRDVQASCRRDMGFTDLAIKRSPLRHIPPFKNRCERYLMKDFDHKKTQEVDLLVGAFFLMKKDVFDEVGGFDPRYFLFMEDFDLCKKVRSRGYKIVYYPEVEAVHYHKRLSQGGILEQFTKKTFWLHVSSAIKYFWKWRKTR